MTLQQRLQNSQWRSLLSGADNIYFAPHIPVKKLQGAMTYISAAIRPQDIVMLIDDTVFGSAKDGLCLTETELFFKEGFGEVYQFLFMQIQRVEADLGIINHGLLINGTHTLNFSQLDKGTVRALAGLLNELCQPPQQQQQTQTHQKEKVQLNVMHYLFAYFITYPTGQWSQASRMALTDYFAKLKNPDVNQSIAYLIQQPLYTDYEDLLHGLAELKVEMSYEARMQMIESLVYVMALGQIDQEQAQRFMVQLCRVTGVSPAVWADLVDAVYGGMQQDGQHADVPLTDEQNQACKLLDISPEQLSEQSLQTAYRKKMAEFHPDQYQQLPEAVRQLIEQQAQQLNQARSILKDYLNT